LTEPEAYQRKSRRTGWLSHVKNQVGFRREMPPQRVMSKPELLSIHSIGAEFVYNDDWVTLHRASCPSIKTMEVFMGTEEEYGDFHDPGMKFADPSREDLLSWIEEYWWPGHLPQFCKTCKP
jgi:hypothetical protein